MNIILQPKKHNLQQPSFMDNLNLIKTSLQTLSSLREQLQSVLPISEEQRKIITPLTYTLCCKEPSLNVIDGKAGMYIIKSILNFNNYYYYYYFFLKV
jgi:hypothetical protein